MLTDQETDFLFVSDRLRERKKFWKELVKVLDKHQVLFDSLKGTRDIWCVDYMPVQVAPGRFIQFRYNPDYLQDRDWPSTITDGASVAQSVGIAPIRSNLLVDGGNVVRGKDAAILTDKIFIENRSHSRKAVLNALETALEAKPIIIPRDPYDFTGHADGMVRFLDEGTVLVNKYLKDDQPAFQEALKRALKREGLRTIEIPYNPYQNASDDSARGVYINYLQMRGFILLPVFGLPEDDLAFRAFEDLFSGTTIATVEANDIAGDGGVVNCVTWNIKCENLEPVYIRSGSAGLYP